VSAAEHWWDRPIRSVHRCGLRLDDGLEQELHDVAASAYPHETGGLLLGWWEGHVPVVAAWVEVPDSAARRDRWSRNERAAAAALSAARRSYPPHIGYVGDWHSHPADVGPSQADLRAIRRVSRQYEDAVALAVVRRGGRVDTRLAFRGRLTTTDMLVTTNIDPRSRSTY
jgi:integrative and conjugative element protein (TIGR02256 family)